ncbi:unnamed protein product [Ilex paraguariensis]|uniref:EDR1/CTR1/ARMC3-like peptidase-like domain-containing protein n=1 Tax=Ilex paraguariensis TaxID=185542 RepID=A0ABC8V1G5_9AQUA
MRCPGQGSFSGVPLYNPWAYAKCRFIGILEGVWIHRWGLGLIKVLADNVGIPCRLVKGSHYTGVEDDAVNIIKLVNESECLVDLMGAPGTLIPADILSAKDNSFMSYNPKINKIPSLQTANDFGVVSSRPNLLPGEYGGSCQNSAAGNRFPFGRKPSPEKSESLPPLTSASGDTGVGSSGSTSRLPSANQLDHIPSLVIGTSQYKGGRGPKATGDGLRMNVNVVPYSESNAEDTKNLFADLNPFQIKGSGKALMQNNIAGNLGDGFQRPKNNLPSGRPPVPLMWKNRYACNEVPRKNEHGFVEGISPNKNQEANDYNMSSVASSSSTISDKVYHDGYKLPDRFSHTHAENGDRDGDVLLKQELEIKEHGKNAISRHDQGRFMQDKVIGTNMKLKDPESPSSSVDHSGAQGDPMIDDVSKCEIPWEHLVIGERIGLGSYGEVYHADWNGTVSSSFY